VRQEPGPPRCIRARRRRGDGHRQPGAEVPWFWTDQFGTNYQVAGRIDAARWIERHGPGERLMLFGLDTHGVLTGAVAVAGADMRHARKLIEQGWRPIPPRWPTMPCRCAR
jgi:hypothetical protein